MWEKFMYNLNIGLNNELNAHNLSQSALYPNRKRHRSMGSRKVQTAAMMQLAIETF
jgi:hypothetical protein